MRERIVYRHPKGRFEVIERSGKDIFGNLYRIREARLTPEKDERGLLTNPALPAPFRGYGEKRVRRAAGTGEGQAENDTRRMAQEADRRGKDMDTAAF